MVGEKIKISVESTGGVVMEEHTYHNPSGTLFEELSHAYESSDFYKKKKVYILIQQMKPWGQNSKAYSISKTMVKDFRGKK